MFCSDLVELVRRRIVVELKQQTIVPIHNGYECVVLVGDVSMSIVPDNSGDYEVVLVLCRQVECWSVGLYCKRCKYPRGYRGYRS
jgi:hypothetical protein